MNWRDKTVVKILLFVAIIVADEKWMKDIWSIANLISAELGVKKG